MSQDVFQKVRRRQELVGMLLGVVAGVSPDEGAELLAEAALRLSESESESAPRPNDQRSDKTAAARPPDPPPTPKPSPKAKLPARGEYTAKIIEMFKRFPMATNADVAQAIYGSTDSAMVKNIRTLLWTMRKDGLISQRNAAGAVEVLE